MGDMVIPALKETGEALQSVVGELLDAIRGSRRPLTDGASGVRILKTREAAGATMRENGASVARAGSRP